MSKIVSYQIDCYRRDGYWIAKVIAGEHKNTQSWQHRKRDAYDNLVSVLRKLDADQSQPRKVAAQNAA